MMYKTYIIPWKKQLKNKMKLKLFYLIIISALLSYRCEVQKEKDEDSTLEHETEKTIHSILEGDMEILVIDDCQYLVYKETIGSNHSYGYMAHKGNCSNPIHCYNEIEDTLSAKNIDSISKN